MTPTSKQFSWKNVLLAAGLIFVVQFLLYTAQRRQAVEDLNRGAAAAAESERAICEQRIAGLERAMPSLAHSQPKRASATKKKSAGNNQR